MCSREDDPSEHDREPEPQARPARPVPTCPICHVPVNRHAEEGHGYEPGLEPGA